MTDDRTITLTRIIAAPPEVIWRCWTDPAILPLWFGPEGYFCHTHEIDLVPGGQWRFDMIGPDGRVWPNRHRFTHHDRPHRIAFLLDGDDDAQEPISVVVTLTPEAGGTRFAQVMTFPSAAACAGAKAFGAEALGETTFDKMEAQALSL